jgi:phosphatidylserine decarboxylase
VTLGTFNQFFYRRLKPGARPTESPDDPNRLVSAADCRLMAFETVTEATRLWIKGREFTVGRLFGPGYRSLADRYAGGALAIFRLAPQDYHRFHCPVDGVIGAMSYIAGEYHTVNVSALSSIEYFTFISVLQPQAIRTGLDVYGENARKVVPIDSPQFGKVMAVCVGATMVGSIVTTVHEGQVVKRGDEFGYFAFGMFFLLPRPYILLKIVLKVGQPLWSSSRKAPWIGTKTLWLMAVPLWRP